jgi:ribosomal protein S18 acetylase RimI-like enzyme
VTPVGFGWRRAADGGLSFRRMADDDLPFLRKLYDSTRQQELAPLPWPDEQKAAFLEMQFRAQHAHYRRHYADMDWLVILREGEAIGRLYLMRDAREHCIVDIAFLSEHRGHGFGTALMRDLLDETAAAAKPMSIHVEKFNPAQRLYRRLGFVTVGDAGAYDLMRWDPR